MLKALALIILLMTSTSSFASKNKAICNDANTLGGGMFTGVCWSAMFPIKVAGKKMTWFGDGSVPDRSTDKSICQCGGEFKDGNIPTYIGVTAGFWQPAYLVELTRQPYCLAALGGLRLGGASSVFGGVSRIGGRLASGDTKDGKDLGMFHFHQYAYPLMQMLRLVNTPQCMISRFNSFDVGMLGESMPTWYDDHLALLTNPEALIFNNPVAMAAVSADCIATTATGKASNKVFWGAGCWGNMYPLSGNIVSIESPVRATSLLSAKAMYLLGRIGILTDATGIEMVSGECRQKFVESFYKDSFKKQMLFPMPESKSSMPAGTNSSRVDTNKMDGATSTGVRGDEPNPRGLVGKKTCTHAVGESAMSWGEWRNRPSTGEDKIYVYWQWIDCCVGVVGD